MAESACMLSLTEVARAIREKQLSCVEVATACLERIEQCQPLWNAFIHVEPEAALAAARKADAALARGEILGPLHGVPMGHKDTCFRRGRLATCGSRIRSQFIPECTATVLGRLDAAGALDLGGVNTSDSGCNPFGFNVLAGRARNPWDPERVTGGSSSGSAAAVAGRLVFASLGGDAGGSVRLPASMCGVVGLKPTEGLISRHGILPLSDTLDTCGPITRTVADCAAVTGVVAGHDPADGMSIARDVPDYGAELERPIEGRRIGIASNYFQELLDEDVERALAATLDVFRDEGAEIVELAVPDPAPMDVMGNVIIFAEGATVHAKWLRDRADDYTPITRRLLESGLCCPASRYIQALSCRGPALAAYMDAVFSGVDVLFTPVLPGSVPTVAQVEANLKDPRRMPLELARNTKPANFLGVPALSVPCGTTDDGMPVAFQLMGRPFGESLLFNIGHVFQRATAHHERCPAPWNASTASARNSYQPPAAGADLTESAALNAARVLDVPAGTPARPDSRSPCRSRHLRALASRPGGNCALDESMPAPDEF